MRPRSCGRERWLEHWSGSFIEYNARSPGFVVGICVCLIRVVFVRAGWFVEASIAWPLRGAIMLKRKDSMVVRTDGDKLDVTPLGAGNEVGRSCVYMTYKGKTVLVRASVISEAVFLCLCRVEWLHVFLFNAVNVPSCLWFLAILIGRVPVCLIIGH